ncbi:MAG: hypothetical protein ABSA16_08515 [Thermoguttaceae bacterium]|jgi:hypothetical protein
MAKTSRVEQEQYWQGMMDRQRASNENIVRFRAKAGALTASFYTWRRIL